MKKTLLSFCMLVFALCSYADRAPKGIWQTITLHDGTQVRAELQGDEFAHFWQTSDGECFREIPGGFVKTSAEEILNTASERRAMLLGTASNRMGAKGQAHAVKPILGHKKGLLILVDFADVKFSMDDPKTYYERMANEEGYHVGNQKGSLHDYFRDQSNGKFILDFDVVGPIHLTQPQAYYGGDTDKGQDEHADAMIGQAAVAAANEVDMADYDWDSDGEVEQIYVLYAGKGQANGGGAETVWPHKSRISGWSYSNHKPMTLDGVKVDVYACSNEMRGNAVEGIGTICHEFSHCLGYPDLYDVTVNSGSKKPNYGMGSWDLMNSGNHNGNGYVPCGYTSWEKMMAGWITPIELKGDMKVEGMKPMSQHGDAYIVYNEGNRNEYYLFENRKQEGWDRSLAGEGLLVLHVDYDSRYFSVSGGRPNTYQNGNDRQRLTIIPADNHADDDDEAGDPYPNGNNSSLTNLSTPAATVYNANVDGTNLMNIRVSKIALDENGYVSFFFGDPVKAGAGVLFAESFDQCLGTGANDNSWMTMKTGVGKFAPDNEGWEGDYMKGASYCARFGNTAAASSVTTPAFDVDGEAELSFLAAPFAEEGSMQLKVTTDNSGVSLAESTFQLVPRQWTACSVKMNGKGKVRLTFAPDCRLYLDEIMVVSASQSAVHGVQEASPARATGVYNLYGQKVQRSGKGIYIVNGKKVAY